MAAAKEVLIYSSTALRVIAGAVARRVAQGRLVAFASGATPPMRRQTPALRGPQGAPASALRLLDVAPLCLRKRALMRTRPEGQSRGGIDQHFPKSEGAFVETCHRQSSFGEVTLAKGPAFDPALALGDGLMGTRFAGSPDESGLVPLVPGPACGVTLVSLHLRISLVEPPGGGRGLPSTPKVRRRSKSTCFEHRVLGQAVPAGRALACRRVRTLPFCSGALPACTPTFRNKIAGSHCLRAYPPAVEGCSGTSHALPFVGQPS